MIDEKPSVRQSEYECVETDTLLFLTGIALSGKSTLAPLIASSINGCALQSMDILRLISQEFESLKPEKERNSFVELGSCDSYTAIGDGQYTKESLIAGFNQYSTAVFSILGRIIPKMEVQGASKALFEGVQLTPSLVKPYLRGNNKLLILATDAESVKKRAEAQYAGDQSLIERYSVEKLMHIQEEILRQSVAISDQQKVVVENISNHSSPVQEIFNFLLGTGVIKKSHV